MLYILQRCFTISTRDRLSSNSLKFEFTISVPFPTSGITSNKPRSSAMFVSVWYVPPRLCEFIYHNLILKSAKIDQFSIYRLWQISDVFSTQIFLSISKVIILKNTPFSSPTSCPRHIERDIISLSNHSPLAELTLMILWSSLRT